MPRAFASIAFTPETLALQEADGSAGIYARLSDPEVPSGAALGPAEAAFLEARDGFYQASVNSAGWPYVQFRGGRAGFLKVLGAQEIGYADLRGNRQHLSAGNIVHDGRVHLFAMDYPNRRRLKVWGEATLLRPDQDPALAAFLAPEEPRARVQRLVKIRVRAFDWNCPAHIPQRYTLEEVETELDVLRERSQALAADNRRLRALVAETAQTAQTAGAAGAAPGA